jgi:hypothetical protein
VAAPVDQASHRATVQRVHRLKRGGRAAMAAALYYPGMADILMMMDMPPASEVQLEAKHDPACEENNEGDGVRRVGLAMRVRCQPKPCKHARQRKLFWLGASRMRWWSDGEVTHTYTNITAAHVLFLLSASTPSLTNTSWHSSTSSLPMTFHPPSLSPP